MHIYILMEIMEKTINKYTTWSWVVVVFVLGLILALILFYPL